MNPNDADLIRNNIIVTLVQLKNATKELNDAKDRLIEVLGKLAHID